MTISRGRKGKRPAYRITADRESLQLIVNDEFWNETIIDPRHGTSQLDINIATVCQEIRAALYYVATDGTKH